MSTRRVSSSSSSSSFSASHPVHQRKHDVFLSFYGEDTRRSFTDHLYKDLKQKGIFVFRDDEKLKQGELLNSGLLKAIEESKYAIVILSQNFAFSRWCLSELAKIIQCRKDMGLEVIPVFYHVDPSHVGHQSDTFAEALAKHEQNSSISKEDVQKWRVALREVRAIKGWHIEPQAGYESTFIEKIVANICTKRRSTVFRGIVGIDQFREMEVAVMDLLDIKSDDVRFIGLYGIDGVGKTTLAEFIYGKIKDQFEASSLVSRVSEETRNHGAVFLQKQILSQIFRMEREVINGWDDGMVHTEIRERLPSKRVLIILDNVDENQQLEDLAGSREWFGRGSRVIVTSKEEQVLKSHEVDIHIYRVKKLEDDEALKLFCQTAFKKPQPADNYEDLSKDFVNYAKGIPRILKVLGRFLFDKGIDEWKRAWDKLQVNRDTVSGALEIKNLLLNTDQRTYESEEEYPDQYSRPWAGFENELLEQENNTGAAKVRRKVDNYDCPHYTSYTEPSTYRKESVETPLPGKGDFGGGEYEARPDVRDGFPSPGVNELGYGEPGYGSGLPAPRPGEGGFEGGDGARLDVGDGFPSPGVNEAEYGEPGYGSGLPTPLTGEGGFRAGEYGARPDVSDGFPSPGVNELEYGEPGYGSGLPAPLSGEGGFEGGDGARPDVGDGFPSLGVDEPESGEGLPGEDEQEPGEDNGSGSSE